MFELVKESLSFELYIKSPVRLFSYARGSLFCTLYIGKAGDYKHIPKNISSKIFHPLPGWQGKARLAIL